MAARQAERHEVGRAGEAAIVEITGGTATTHKAPFDVVDFASGVAYEVKTMSALSKDLKIHIAPASMAKKRAFARRYGLKAILFAVVIYDEDTVKVYKSPLKASIRVNQMKAI